MSLTVTRLARSCNLARSTVLYYESIGLLTRPRRSAGNYRVYSDKDLDRLRQICTYRDAGVPLADIRSILDAPGGLAAGRVEDRANVRQWHARVAVSTDLAQAVEILVRVNAVVPGAPPGPRQQADGFVVQH